MWMRMLSEHSWALSLAPSKSLLKAVPLLQPAFPPRSMGTTSWSLHDPQYWDALYHKMQSQEPDTQYGT